MTALFDTRYYRVTKLFSSLVGLWPLQSPLKRKAIQTIIMLSIILYLPPQFKRLLYVWGRDFDAVCTCIPAIIIIVVCVSKIITMDRFESKMRMLLRQIETDWAAAAKGEEHESFVAYALRTRKLCVLYAIILCNGLSCFIMVPTIPLLLDVVSPLNETRLRALAFEADYGIDMQTYWFWLWLHTSVTSTMVIFSILGADLIYITFIVYNCYIFATVRQKLEAIGSMDHRVAGLHAEYNNEDERFDSKRRPITLKECVIRHKKAIECSQLLQSIYTWNFFVTLGLNLLVISVSGIQLVSKLSKWNETIMSIMYVIGQMMHLFFLSLMAQYLLDQSLDVCISAYMCSWYDMPTEMQKDLILILMRSNRPCKLTAGKTCVMSLENFCTMLQTSMSYFTMLASCR